MQLFVDFVNAINDNDNDKARFIAHEIIRREKLFISEIKEVALKISLDDGNKLISACERFFTAETEAK